MSCRRKNKDPGPGQRKITCYFKPATKEHTETIDLVSDSDSDGEVTKFDNPSPPRPASSSSCANQSITAKSPYVTLDLNTSPKSADVSKKRKIMEEQSEVKEKAEKKITGSKFGFGESSFMCSAKTVPIFPSVNVTPMEDCSGSTHEKEISPSPQGSSLQPAVDSSHQIKRNSFDHDKDYEDVELTENKDSSFEAEDSDGDEIAEKRKRYRSFTMEIETHEFVEKVAGLPSIVSIDASELQKAVTDAKKRQDMNRNSFEEFCRSQRVSIVGKVKKAVYKCCEIDFRSLETFKNHVVKIHLPSASLSLSNLDTYTPLKLCGNFIEPYIEAGIKGKASAEFTFHFERHATRLKTLGSNYKYIFLLIKGLPPSVSETGALEYASQQFLTVETYTGKFKKKGKEARRGDIVCAEYHFRKSDKYANGSIVTQHMLQGYRCFYVAEEENRSFEKEEVERVEMHSQLFNKLCSKFTESNDTKLKFSSRQRFEHEVASKYLSKEIFLKMAQDVVGCMGQVVVTGNDSVTVPFNGLYGQVKPVRLVERFLDPTSNFKFGDDVEKKRPHVPMSLEKVTSRQMALGLDLDYNIETPKAMETLWNILHTKYTCKLGADREHTIALVIIVPSSYEYRKNNVHHFLSEEKMHGRKVRYTFLVDTERYFASKFCDSMEKYIVLRRWNFSSLDCKNRFFNIACIYSHFQTALSSPFFEYVDFKSTKLGFVKARRILSDLDLRYAFALGNSGRPVICLQENCTENHYIYSDQTFAVPIHIDERVIVDIPLKNNRFTAY